MLNEMFSALGHIRILPLRVRLDLDDTPPVKLLRSVWGAALHELEFDLYQTIFHPPDESCRIPKYILREAPRDSDSGFAFEWILIGETIDRVATLMRAWQMAFEKGLGKQRRQTRIVQVQGMAPAGELLQQPIPWSLENVYWPLPGDPERTPCRLQFPASVRLLRGGETLITDPSLEDLVRSLSRRIEQLLPEGVSPPIDWESRCCDVAQGIPTTHWLGETSTFQRRSHSQQRQLKLPGTVGFLDLPWGAGELWPLLASAMWLHIGKTTVCGLGKLVISEFE